MKTLIINNYDSFTYNLFQLIAAVNGEEPLVIYNNELDWQELQRLQYDNIVISPGPGNPDNPRDFGICQRVIQETQHPLLGVCLGHQGIWSSFGGRIIHAPQPMHGRVSTIHHNHSELFKNIPPFFEAVRYHSLIAARDSIPTPLQVTAQTEEGLIMAIRHKTRPLWGVQFHPESIGTLYGRELMENFKKLTALHHVPSASSVKKRTSPSLSRPPSISPKYTVQVHILSHFPDPQEVYKALFSEEKYAIWLDSSRVMQNFSRFSFMGSLGGPLSYLVNYEVNHKRITIERNGETLIYYDKSIFTFLREELKRYSVQTPTLPFNFNCGFAGFFGYELKSETMGVSNKHQSIYPDAQFLFLDRLLAFDHMEEVCYLLALTPEDQSDTAKLWFQEISSKLDSLSQKKPKIAPLPQIHREGFLHQQAEYTQMILQCLHHLQQGESYQLCLTNRLKYETSHVHPLHYYLHLRHIAPAPYSAFLNFSDTRIACASMERFLNIDSDRVVETKPIKGTLPRGKSEEEDKRYVEALTQDEKFRSENLIIIDLLRNDLGKVCTIDSVHVPQHMQVETYSHLHQLVSTIRGTLRSDKDALDCFHAAFPGGSMTGAPKIRTVTLLDDIEQEARGIYSGSIGFLTLNGTADFNIVIRTALFKKGEMIIGVGGAIISLSDPAEEFQEILTKAKPLQEALFNGSSVSFTPQESHAEKVNA